MTTKALKPSEVAGILQNALQAYQDAKEAFYNVPKAQKADMMADCDRKWNNLLNHFPNDNVALAAYIAWENR